MKTISGKLISSKPISLSRAARNLSGFAVHENGASDAVSVYLKRAADAFNSLVSFHKELKNPHSARKHRNIEENSDAGKPEILEGRGKSKKNPDFGVKIEEPLEVDLKRGLVVGVKDDKYLKNRRRGEKNREETVKMESYEVGEGMEEKKHKEEKVNIIESMDIEQGTPDQVGEKRKRTKHKKEKANEEPIKIEPTSDREAGDKETQVLDEVGKGKKNKQESVGIEQQADQTEEDSVKKRDKKKRKKRDGEEEGESMKVEERKSREVDGGETIDLAEHSSQRKRKRRKSEGEH